MCPDPLGDHSRVRRQHSVDDPAEVDVDHEVPVLGGHLVRRTADGDAGVVEQVVDPTRPVDGLVDDLHQPFEVAHVDASALDGRSAGRCDPPRGSGDGIAVHVGQNDVGTEGRKSSPEGTSDPRRATGHECGRAGEG